MWVAYSRLFRFRGLFQQGGLLFFVRFFNLVLWISILECFHDTWYCILVFYCQLTDQGGCWLYSAFLAIQRSGEYLEYLALLTLRAFRYMSRPLTAFLRFPLLLLPFLSLPPPVPYSFLQEVLVLDRLVYRNRSQHRNAKYFTLALEVRREVYLGTPQCDTGIVFLGRSSCFVGIWWHFFCG